MEHTPFIARHEALGAKMMEFAGFLMPVSYTSIREEHLAVRERAGVFDVSHMGEFILKGPGSLDLIQQLTCNDAAVLEPGQAQYSCLINEQGGIIDDLLIYCLEKAQAYMLVVNASNIEKDWQWINDHNAGKMEMHNISKQCGLLAVQGPMATRILQPLTELDLAGMKYYTFAKGRFAGLENVLVSATGYTGSGGVEIYFENKPGQADRIWEAIFAEGKPHGLLPVGLGARDTLRIEKGFCLYGNDIDDTTTPLEAGLGWITKFRKTFTASNLLEDQKKQGVSRKLVGFEVADRAIPRHGYAITDGRGGQVGTVTSGTHSPCLGKPIGMGYIQPAFSAPDTEVSILVRGKEVPARVVRFPFL